MEALHHVQDRDVRGQAAGHCESSLLLIHQCLDRGQKWCADKVRLKAASGRQPCSQHCCMACMGDPGCKQQCRGGANSKSTAVDFEEHGYSSIAFVGFSIGS